MYIENLIINVPPSPHPRKPDRVDIIELVKALALSVAVILGLMGA